MNLGVGVANRTIVGVVVVVVVMVVVVLVVVDKSLSSRLTKVCQVG